MRKLLLLTFVLLWMPALASAATLSKPGNNLGLVGYWSFNEGTSTIAHDFSGKGNNGTISGASWSNGKLSSALTFNGSSNFVRIPVVSSLNSGASIGSVFAWVKYTSSATNIVYSTWDGSGGYQLYVASGNPSGWGSTGGTFSSGVSVNDGMWHFIGVVFDGTNGITYVDGVQRTSSLRTFANTSKDVQIGTQCSGVNSTTCSAYFNGSIDEVRVYNRVVSAAEVAALYKVGSTRLQQSQNPGTLSSGLTGYWAFDGGDILGTFVYDRSGSGNNATLVGSPGKGIGKVGQALVFDGTAKSVTTSKAVATLCSTSTCSLSVWLYPKSTSPTIANTWLGQEAFGDSNGNMGIFRGTISGADRIWIYNWDGNEDRIGITYTSNQWTHVVWVHSGGTLYAYANGALVTSTASGAQAGPGNIGLGKVYAGSADWNGLIDDARVYNRALTTSEIQQLYNLGTGTHANASSQKQQVNGTLSSGLTLLWTFDGADVTDKVYDRSGNANNGYLSSSARATSTLKTIGKLGQALNFNGVDDGVENLSFSLGSAFTLSMWVNPSTSMGSNDNFAGAWSPGWLFRTGTACTNSNYIEFFSGATSYCSSGAVLQASKWQQIGVTYDGSIYTLYYNGASAGASAGSQAAPTGSVIRIGRISLNPYSFPGKIDDVRVYNRALTSTEMKQLYNMGN